MTRPMTATKHCWKAILKTAKALGTTVSSNFRISTDQKVRKILEVNRKNTASKRGYPMLQTQNKCRRRMAICASLRASWQIHSRKIYLTLWMKMLRSAQTTEERLKNIRRRGSGLKVTRGKMSAEGRKSYNWSKLIRKRCWRNSN